MEVSDHVLGRVVVETWPVRETPIKLKNFWFRGAYFLFGGIKSGKYRQPLRKIFTFGVELDPRGFTQWVAWTRRGNDTGSQRTVASISQVPPTLVGGEGRDLKEAQRRQRPSKGTRLAVGLRCGAPSSLAGKVPAGVEDAGFFEDTICFTTMASVVGIRTRHPPKRAGRNSLPPQKKGKTALGPEAPATAQNTPRTQRHLRNIQAREGGQGPALIRC